MCICIVCVHIYTNIGPSFYFGKVTLVTLRLMGKCMGLEIVPQCGGTPAPSTVMAFPLLWLLRYQNLASVTEQSNSQDSSYNNDSSGVSSFPGEQRHTSSNGPTNPKPSATDIYSHGAELIKKNDTQKEEFSSRIIFWFKLQSPGRNPGKDYGNECANTKRKRSFFSFPWVWWNL